MARELERDLGVRHIGSRFNRVDGLSSDAHFLSEFGCTHTAGFANCGEIGLYAAHYFLNCTISSFVSIRTERAARFSRPATSRKAPSSPKSGLSLALSASRI